MLDDICQIQEDIFFRNQMSEARYSDIIYFRGKMPDVTHKMPDARFKIKDAKWQMHNAI